MGVSVRVLMVISWPWLRPTLGVPASGRKRGFPSIVTVAGSRAEVANCQFKANKTPPEGLRVRTS
jgi:hypothetical protein